MTDTLVRGKRSVSTGLGAWVMAAGGLLGLAISIFDYFWTGNGIHGTEGVVLVICSSALILIAALLFALALLPWGWLRVPLDVLLVLGIIGTAVAGYFLEAWILVGFMVLALIGWLIHIFTGGAARPAR
jgi:hypothetical protein